MTAAEVAAFLEPARTGVLTTLDREGWPHSTGMWFAPDDRVARDVDVREESEGQERAPRPALCVPRRGRGRVQRARRRARPGQRPGDRRFRRGERRRPPAVRPLHAADDGLWPTRTGRTSRSSARLANGWRSSSRWTRSPPGTTPSSDPRVKPGVLSNRTRSRGSDGVARGRWLLRCWVARIGSAETMRAAPRAMRNVTSSSRIRRPRMTVTTGSSICAMAAFEGPMRAMAPYIA